MTGHPPDDVTVSGLTVAGPSGLILDRVDLRLRSGTVTGLVGASGSGKTTLALALIGHVGAGLEMSGRVRVAGQDPFTRAGRLALRGRLVTFLPQDPVSALDPARTVVGQLRTACRVAHPHAHRAERETLIDQAVRDASFERSLLRRRPLQLSGGQAQRALLAWTFLARPRLLILDEPTSGLDTRTAHRVSSLFTELPWKPAVLLVSHDRALIHQVSDRILEIDGGRLIDVRTELPAQARPPAQAWPPAQARPLARPTKTTTVPPVLSLQAVTIRRGDRVVVRDAALTLGAGELVAIQGPSGSGKTSLARALCGFAPPASGRLFMGDRVTAWDAGTRARRGGPFIAYVGQDARAALHPSETVRLTLRRALTAAHRRRTDRFCAPEAVMRAVDLPFDVWDRMPSELSGGQRHRVALARAIAAAPDALVCDETTAALDRTTAVRILDTLDQLRRDTGIPILLITHQHAVAARADRVLTLEEARLT